MLNSLQNSTCSLIFRTLLVYRTTPTISTKNPFLHFIQLSPHYYLLTYLQYYPCNPYKHFLCQYQKQFTPKEISLPQPHNQYRFFFFSIWVFFHEHSRITGLQGKGEGISLTPHYYFCPLHTQLDISRAITAES